MKQSLVDGLLPDLVSEFHDCLVRAIDQTVVNIKTVKMDASGLEDIEAEIV